MRTLSERIAPLSAPGRANRALASFAARVHEQGSQLTDSFERTISLLEVRVGEQRGGDARRRDLERDE